MGSSLKNKAGNLASGGNSWKSRIIAMLFGLAVGVGVDLLLQYIFTMYVYPATDEKLPDGSYAMAAGQHTLFIDNISIYPWQNVQGHYYMYFDDLILLASTVILLFTKKFWFVIGYFAGWYTSGYMHLYTTLKLPVGIRDVPYSS